MSKVDCWNKVWPKMYSTIPWQYLTSKSRSQLQHLYCYTQQTKLHHPLDKTYPYTSKAVCNTIIQKQIIRFPSYQDQQLAFHQVKIKHTCFVLAKLWQSFIRLYQSFTEKCRSVLKMLLIRFFAMNHVRPHGSTAQQQFYCTIAARPGTGIFMHLTLQK